MADEVQGFLQGIRVLELADELGEYCGKLLAGLGAEVVKVEPVGGERTRGYGPFYRDDPHPNRSLHFWHYNFGKLGIVLDLDSAEGVEQFLRLAETADVIIDARPRDFLEARGLGWDRLRADNPGLIIARISPFGDDGPWADYQGSDLVHLALGGMMMNTGYDARPSGEYDTPPIAPQMWHAYHIAGETTAIQIMAALNYRLESGRGQLLSASVHDAVSKNTETDLPAWIYSRAPHLRQTCRHSLPQFAETRAAAMAQNADMAGISRTKDGRWMLAHRAFFPGFATPLSSILAVMRQHGFDHRLEEEENWDLDHLRRPEVSLRIGDVIDRFLAKFPYDADLWKDGQAAGLPWAPLRRPEENLADAHWAARETFCAVTYPEVGETFVQTGAKWFAPGIPWPKGPRAPLLGEHNDRVLGDLERRPVVRPAGSAQSRSLSRHGRPFALSGVRIIDLSWLLASGGAGRFFTALGAEVIKVEHRSRVDGMRFGGGVVGPGGRAARDAATGPVSAAPGDSLNRSGAFMEINAGKRSFSLNLRDERGKGLLAELLKDADMIIEGFSPGTMERMGLGYDRLREINPRIVYVQQSGMGQVGTYGAMRSFGPSAQAFSGLSEMSGLPEPYPPAGIGFSYLDWFGAYQMASAMMAALYRQRRTGLGCWIDSSQVETGLYLAGTAILDYSANGRRWRRYGNRSPYKAAAPHGAYPTAGEDRWIAIAAYTEEHWGNLARVLGALHWTSDPKLATLALRLSNQDHLDAVVGAATAGWDGYALMEALQTAGVPAGVCQTAQDRCERDPQLRHLGWLVELDQEEIGRWPVREVPVKFSETPPYVGGALDRHGPSYGQDNDYVLRELLGLTDAEITELTSAGVL